MAVARLVTHHRVTQELRHSGVFLREFYHQYSPKDPKSRMPKTRSGYESSDLKITSGVFSIVDRVAGYVSTDHELRVKLLWENAKEKGLRLPKAEVPERRIVIGLKRTRVSRLSSLEKAEG
jgi:hypothetical protein